MMNRVIVIILMVLGALLVGLQILKEERLGRKCSGAGYAGYDWRAKQCYTKTYYQIPR